jgi:hypothetical protein
MILSNLKINNKILKIHKSSSKIAFFKFLFKLSFSRFTNLITI